MAEVEVTSADPLLACCLCTDLLRDAVQLACLHNCCRQCFSTAASQSNCQGVTCVSCGTLTHVGSEQPNGFVDGQVQCYALVAESGVCGVCTGKGDHDKSAVVWCLTCRHSLCEDCVNEHKLKNSEHTMQCFEGLKGMNELVLQVTLTACAVHQKPCEMACLTCQQAKCISCGAKCKENLHEMRIVSEDSFDKYVVSLVTRITTTEKDLLRKSEVLEMQRSFFRFTRAARIRHLSDLKQRKRRIIDAVEMAYENIGLATNGAYDDLEAKGDEVASSADRIASELSDARKYICRLIESNDSLEIFKQQKIIRERLRVLSGELDLWSERLATAVGEVKIESSLSKDLDEVVGAWIGKPQVYSASSSLLQQLQPPQCFSFGSASVSVQLPVQCCDVALTKDGRSLLLAAREDGLIKFSCSSGRELSRWRPPKYNSSLDDSVQAVAALSDTRAAVSLLHAECIVLLKRREERRRGKDGGRAAVSSWWQRLVVAAGGDAWTEQLRVQLPWCPWRLSAHGDVLAASGWLGDRLQLLSSSSGQLLLSNKLQCEYYIGSLAVTSRAVVTGSNDKVKLDFYDRRAAYVLDARSLATDGSDKRLWRHVLSSSDVKEQEEDELRGICADSSGGCLYVALWRSDSSSGRVSALSLADGSELRRVALSFDPPAAASAEPLLLPVLLSLSGDATLSSSSSSGRVLLLAALSWDSETKLWRTVTVHRRTSDELP